MLSREQPRPKIDKYLNCIEAFGVSHLAMEKLEPAEETVLIQGKIIILKNFNSTYL
jgi:hypothetical protein